MCLEVRYWPSLLAILATRVFDEPRDTWECRPRRMKRDLSPARRHLLSTQKKIYTSLKTEAEQLLGETPEPIFRYERGVSERIHASSRSSLEAQGSSQIAADLRDPQSRRHFNRGLPHLRPSPANGASLNSGRDSPGRKLVYRHRNGSEPFSSRPGSFPGGKTFAASSFTSLLSTVPNGAFRGPIIGRCLNGPRNTRFRLIALNRPKELFYPYTPSARALLDLRKRDQWAAGIVSDLFSAKRCRMIILYGELHVGRTHLPPRNSENLESLSFLRHSNA